MSNTFSLARVYAILLKEFLQMRRDRITLAMIVGVPLMQLFLFGFAINYNPRALPTVISVDDPGVFARSVTVALENSSYFNIVKQTHSPQEARRALGELRAFRLLQGVRGQPAADIDALVDAVVRISWLAVDLGDCIAELDINPLSVLPAGRGVRMVDALVVPRQA